MRYCVIKDTIRWVDKGENSIESMLQNARNAGFEENEVEILTEEEYQARLENEPKPPQDPTIEERLQALETLELERILGGM